MFWDEALGGAPYYDTTVNLWTEDECGKTDDNFQKIATGLYGDFCVLDTFTAEDYIQVGDPINCMTMIATTVGRIDEQMDKVMAVPVSLSLWFRSIYFGVTDTEQMYASDVYRNLKASYFIAAN